MSKRHGAAPSRSRKKRKENYSSVDLDQDEHPGKVETIRVWDIVASKTTGRVSATRKIHRHVNEGAAKPTYEEPTPAVEDVGNPAEHELPTKPATKHKREKTTKQNDSVSSVPILSSNLIITC